MNAVAADTFSSRYAEGAAKRQAETRGTKDETAAKQPRIQTAPQVSTRRGYREWLFAQAASDQVESKRRRIDQSRNHSPRIQGGNEGQGKGENLPMTAKAEFKALVMSMRSAGTHCKG